MKLNSKYFDEIRSKKTKKTKIRNCESIGCNESGDYVAKNKNGNINYYCIDHIKLFNKSYNFFADMSENEIIDFQTSSMTGHRPTWKMSSNGTTDQKKYSNFGEKVKFNDPFGFFEQEKNNSKNLNRRSSNSTDNAIKELGLSGRPSKSEIQSKFKELVKNLHPDVNGKDKNNEERLKLVINAYNKLKSSGLC